MVLYVQKLFCIFWNFYTLSATLPVLLLHRQRQNYIFYIIYNTIKQKKNTKFMQKRPKKGRGLCILVFYWHPLKGMIPRDTSNGMHYAGQDKKWDKKYYFNNYFYITKYRGLYVLHYLWYFYPSKAHNVLQMVNQRHISPSSLQEKYTFLY